MWFISCVQTGRLCFHNWPLEQKNLCHLSTKPTKWYVRPAKTQISLGIGPVWSESSLCTLRVANDPRFLHADNEDSDQTARMPRLIWVFAGCTCHFVGFVMWRLIYKEMCIQQRLRSACTPVQTIRAIAVYMKKRWVFGHLYYRATPLMLIDPYQTLLALTCIKRCVYNKDSDQHAHLYRLSELLLSTWRSVGSLVTYTIEPRPWCWLILIKLYGNALAIL